MRGPGRDLFPGHTQPKKYFIETFREIFCRIFFVHRKIFENNFENFLYGLKYFFKTFPENFLPEIFFFARKFFGNYPVFYPI